MPVKHALLALLAQRDLTGYELKLRFERALGDFWQLNSGQVYSTLERLRRSGLVLRQDERAAVARTRYTLLPRGRRELEQWLAAPLPRLRPVRDPLFVKLVFMPPEHAAPVLKSFATETRKYSQALETLTALVARAPLSFTGSTRWLIAEAARLEFAAHREWLATVGRVLAPFARAPEHAREGAATPAPARGGRQRLAAVRAALPRTASALPG